MPQVYSTVSAVSNESNALYVNGNTVTPKFAIISASTSGDNTVVSAVSGKKIRVLHYSLVCAAAVTLTWKSGTATNISGGMAFGANNGISTPYSPQGLFETASGQALVLSLSTDASVGGHLTYIEV